MNPLHPLSRRAAWAARAALPAAALMLAGCAPSGTDAATGEKLFVQCAGCHQVGPNARAGFAPHRHANMEIVSVVIAGALAHADSTGNEQVLRPGEVQWMSAGHGIEHSEYNGSDAAPVHFLQVWIQPARLNHAPAYDQKHFAPDARRGRWVLLASRWRRTS